MYRLECIGLFVDSCEHVNDTPGVITDYITLCEDKIIPKKIVKVFPNNKPSIAKSLKKSINEKQVAFQVW